MELTQFRTSPVVVITTGAKNLFPAAGKVEIHPSGFELWLRDNVGSHQGALNFKSTTGWLILCAIAGGSFVMFAHAEEPKVESTPQSIRSERTHFAPPIRVILPPLWEQKASLKHHLWQHRPTNASVKGILAPPG